MFNHLISLLVFAVAGMLLCKSILSLKSIHQYKQGSGFTKTSTRLFAAGCVIIFLFTVGAILLCMLVIIPGDFVHHKTYGYGGGDQMLCDVLFFGAAICALYLSVFDFILLKKLRAIK
jgi:hypothetical protein